MEEDILGDAVISVVSWYISCFRIFFFPSTNNESSLPCPLKEKMRRYLRE